MSAEASWLAAPLFCIAAVYAAVGQAGASGYIAVMALAGLAPLVMKTSALALNILVAAIGTFYFVRAGRLTWRNVYPFAVLGFPFSLLGGAMQLPERLYYPAVGLVLLFSAYQMMRSALDAGEPRQHPTLPPFLPALATGALIGFVSGTTGTGGGVFLAPVVLAMNWGTAHQTAATTAVFNLVNSSAAFVGAYAYWDRLPASLPWWLAAVAAGGAVGAFVGSRYLSERWLRGILAVLLLVSGAKLFW